MGGYWRLEVPNPGREAAREVQQCGGVLAVQCLSYRADLPALLGRLHPHVAEAGLPLEIVHPRLVVAHPQVGQLVVEPHEGLGFVLGELQEGAARLAQGV